MSAAPSGSECRALQASAAAVAPLLGGVLQTAFGWRANFVVTFGVGLVAITLVWWSLPETLANSRLMVRTGLMARQTGPSSSEAGTRPTHHQT